MREDLIERLNEARRKLYGDGDEHDVCDTLAEAAAALAAMGGQGEARESRMVVLRRKQDGTPSVWCDPEIADLVAALNAGGVPTIASCSGHGERPGNIALADGRELLVAKDYAEARAIESASVAHPAPQRPAGVDDAMVKRIAALLHEEATDEPWTFAGVEHPGPDRDYYRGLARKVAALAQQPAEKGEVVVTRNESGEIVLVSRQDSDGRILSVIAEATPKPDTVADETGVEFFAVPEGLHPNTANLVARFATALAEKLAAAERKYGYSDNWARPDWMDECRQKLVEHTAKGDPRDVAAYCAFLWHHGESTAGAKPDAVAGLVDELQVVAEHIHAAYPAQKVKRLRRLVATLAAALQAQSSTEAWRNLAIANADIVNEIREIVGLKGKPGDVAKAVRELAALRAQGEGE